MPTTDQTKTEMERMRAIINHYESLMLVMLGALSVAKTRAGNDLITMRQLSGDEKTLGYLGIDGLKEGVQKDLDALAGALKDLIGGIEQAKEGMVREE